MSNNGGGQTDVLKALSDAAAARAALLARLTTKSLNGLFDRCASAIAEGNREALQALADPNGLAASALLSGDGGVFVDGVETSDAYRVLVAVTDLALTLLESGDVDAAVTAALDLFDYHRVWSTEIDPQAPAFKAPPGTSAAASLVLALLETRRSRPSARFLQLLVISLSSGRPRRHGRACEIPVLFGSSTDQAGTAAHLKLERLEEGPAGLHPDPTRMTFLVTNDEFIAAVQAAWQSSSFFSQGSPCVVWSIIENDEAVIDPTGSSLGAAFAVALDDIALGRKRNIFPTRRTLDPTCAVTGRLEGEHILPVEGYSSKISAAALKNWRVIVPQSSLADAEHEGRKFEVRISGAPDVSSAVRQARTRSNPRFYIALLLVAILVVGAASGIWVARQWARDAEYAQLVQQVSARLASEAPERQLTDPRTGALQALASHRLSPGFASTSAMLQIAQQNAYTAATAQAHDTEIIGVASLGPAVVSLGTDRRLRSWDADTLEPLDEIDLPAGGFDITAIPAASDGTVSAPGSLIIQESEGIVPIDVGADGALSARPRIALNSEPLTIAPGPQPGQFTTVDSGGVAITFTQDGTEIDRVDIGALIGLGTEGVRLVAAAAGPTISFPGRGWDSGRLLLATDVKGVYVYHPSTREAVVTAPAGVVPAIVTDLITTDDRILIGTEAGIVDWNFQEERVEAYPFAGIAGRIDSLAVSTYESALAVSSGSALTIIPLRGAASQANAVVAQPRSGLTTALSAVEREGAFIVGHSDGRLVLADGTAALNQESAEGSNVVEFNPAGDLIQTVSSGTANEITGLRSIDVTSPTTEGGYRVLREFSGREWYQTPFYINDVDSTENLIAAGGLDQTGAGMILVWDAHTAQPIKQLIVPGDTSNAEIESMVTRVRFADEGRMLVAFNVQSGDLTFWDTVTWLKVATKHVGEGVGGMEITPDGLTLVVNSWTGWDANRDLVLRFYDVQSGVERSTVDLDDSLKLSINPIDGRLAMLSADRTLEIRSPDGKTVERTQPLPAEVQDLAWSPDGQRLAAVMISGWVSVLDANSLVATVPPLRTVNGEETVYISWSPDSSLLGALTLQRVGTRIYNGETLLYRPDAETWTRQMCDVAGSDFTATEWSELISPDIRQIALCANNNGSSPTTPPVSSSAPTPAGPLRNLYEGVPALPLDRPTVMVDYGSVEAVQVFADDLAAGSIDRIIQFCSEIHPDAARELYGSEVGRGAILQALSQPGMAAQSGQIWEGEYVSLTFNGRSRDFYQCPSVSIGGETPKLLERDLAYLVERVVARADGTPLSEEDELEWDPLSCDDAPGGWRGEQTAPVSASTPALIVDAARALQGQELTVSVQTIGAERYYDISGDQGELVLRQKWHYVCFGDGAVS